MERFDAVISNDTKQHVTVTQTGIKAVPEKFTSECTIANFSPRRALASEG